MTGLRLGQFRASVWAAEGNGAARVVLAGDNDSRCAIRQILNHTDAVAARGGDVHTCTGSTPATARW